MGESESDDKPLDEQLRYEVSDGVARITLNRPEAQNAITPDQRDRLIDLLDEASADLAVRVVVLTGTGKGFCTGADLRASRPAKPRPEDAPELLQSQRAYVDDWVHLLRLVHPRLDGAPARVVVHAALMVVNDLARLPALRYDTDAQALDTALGRRVLDV